MSSPLGPGTDALRNGPMPEDFHHQTAAELKRQLRQFGIRPRKTLGQHFLLDHNLLEFIARQAELSRDDLVVEVGAGTGLLTAHLAARAGRVLGVEVDPKLSHLAARYLAPWENIQVLNADIFERKQVLQRLVDLTLRTWSRTPDHQCKIVANLPYQIASPLIVLLLSGEFPIERLVLTIQDEVGERLRAKPGTKAYGSLSVLVQALAQVKILRRLPSKVFYPPPKVDSVVVRLIPKPGARQAIQSLDWFEQVRRALFQQRRKLAANALADLFSSPVEAKALLKRARFSPQLRADSATVAQIVRLANLLAAGGRPPAAEGS